MKKRVLIYLLTLILLISLIAGCTPKEESEENISKEESYVPVEMGKAENRTISNEIIISGKVHSNKSIMVIPKIVGKVSSVKVQVGNRVKKDEILFAIDKEDIQKQVDQAKVALEGAKANYAMTKEQIDNAKLALERTRKLYQEGSVSKSQLEQAELAASDTSLEATKTGLNQAQVAYNQAVDSLKNTSIKSPIDGIVSEVNVDEGEYATNTQPSMTIVDTDKVYIQISVTESIINQLFEGKEAVVNVSAAASGDIMGTIDSISPTPDVRTQLYPVKIYLDNKDQKLKEGMFANVKIDTDIRENVVVVKSEAVIEENGKTVIFTVDGDQALVREVKIGFDNGTYIEIIEGLKAGEQIIVKGQNYVEDGIKVKIVRGEK